MTNAALLLFGILAICAVSRHIKRQRDAEPDGDQYDAAQLSDAIRALAELTYQLENADTMIADLNACDPSSLLRGFRAQWCGLDGKRRSIDFMANGQNGATVGLRQAAREQRDQINAEIIETVRALSAALDAGTAPALTLDAVGGTVDETTEPATAGEW